MVIANKWVIPVKLCLTEFRPAARHNHIAQRRSAADVNTDPAIVVAVTQVRRLILRCRA